MLSSKIITATRRVPTSRALSTSLRPLAGVRRGLVVGRKPTFMAAPTPNVVNGKRYLSQPAAHGEWTGPVVSYEEVKRKSDQPSPDIYIIDVRESDEVAQGSIPSSVSIPLSGFNQSLSLPDIQFEAKHGFTKPAKDQEIIVYCRSGKRSSSAADEAKRLGFKNVKNYTGSWLDWTEKESQRKSKNFDDE